MKSISTTLVSLLFIIVITSLNSCKSTVNTEDTESLGASSKMEWWEEARFGMFIHWGVYSIPAGEYNGDTVRKNAEWIMNSARIPIQEYEEYALQFNPIKYNAGEWVKIAKNAGMKYIIITSKHHDGFCIWDSEVTEYDIMDFSPFRRDILGELSEACKKHGIRLGFYHSIMDWHHPDAQAIWEPDYNKNRKDTLENPRFPEYYENYLKPQVRELLTKYDNIDVLWFDGEWIPAYKTEMGKDLYRMITDIDENVIINNRVDKGRMGMQGLNMEGEFAGDFGTPEQEIPDTGVEEAWESCMTMNGSWGYKKSDRNWKSSEDLIRNLIDIVSKGGNYLLNVGPTDEGLIPQASIDRLADMGKWLAVNGEAIYGAKASPFEKPAWGRYTRKEGKVYAHIFDWPGDGKISTAMDEGEIRKCYMLADIGEASLKTKATEEGTSIVLPGEKVDEIASVLVIEKK